MAADDATLIGRESELAVLEEELMRSRSGFVLLIAEPGMGKGRILKELRSRAEARSLNVLPRETTHDSGPWLVVDRRTTIADFRLVLSARSEDDRLDDNHTGRPDIVMIYGYRPAEDFHDWFTVEFLPELGRLAPPRVVLLAGIHADVTALEPLAARTVVLGPLSREAVLAELRAIDGDIDDRMEEAELQTYADAISTDPGLLDTLRKLLPLTAAEPDHRAAGEVFNDD